MTDQTSVEIQRLLDHIRKDFYSSREHVKFTRDIPMLKKAMTWPAAWLRGRGITWTAQTYFLRLSERLADIRRHGSADGYAYFPGYLLRCLQDHFRHNSDLYCDEGRAARNVADLALAKVRFTAGPVPKQATAAENVIDVLAAAHAMLASRARPAKRPTEPSDQLDLFGSV